MGIILPKNTFKKNIMSQLARGALSCSSPILFVFHFGRLPVDKELGLGHPNVPSTGDKLYSVKLSGSFLQSDANFSTEGQNICYTFNHSNYQAQAWIKRPQI